MAQILLCLLDSPHQLGPIKLRRQSMTNDRFAKVKERDRAMRMARDEVLNRVGTSLLEMGFRRAAMGHYTRTIDGRIGHIGFQKHSSGRNVRVLCHVDDGTAGTDPVMGPWSDSYEYPDSLNGNRYSFGWSPREEDIARCAREYCRYINDVIIPWFSHPIPCM